MSARPAIVPWEGCSRSPRAWQADALPIIVDAMKRKVPGLVSAVMGAGKSVVQAELVHLATRNLGDRAIVMTVPRQALVEQLSATVAERVGKRKVGVFYGRKKQAGRPVVVCCNASLPALQLELAGQGRRVALLIADEAHGTEAETLRETIPAINPTCLVGFTATPFRSVPEQSLSLFKHVLYRYTIEDAVRDGVLVEPRVERLQGMDTMPVDEACLMLMNKHAKGPGIISATSIEDAENYAAWLSERGWNAEAIHSKNTPRRRKDLLGRLQNGELQCLVHVSLLAEGVDFPWLRWLCLRRDVQARVRFLQEVGRVLRTDPVPDPDLGPKREGLILDPHLLLGRHGWTTTEAIGKALEEAAEVEEKEATADRGGREIKEKEAFALDLLLAYLTDARNQLEGQGIVQPMAVEPGGWQLAPVSAKQVEAIKGASKLTRHIPGEHRDAIKALAKVPWALTRGQAGDLLDVLYGGSRWCRSRAKQRGMPAYRIQWPARALDLKQPDAEAVNSIRKLGNRKTR